MNTQQQAAYEKYAKTDEPLTPEEVEDALTYSMQRETFHAHSIYALAKEVRGGVITMKELAERLEEIANEMYLKNIIGE